VEASAAGVDATKKELKVFGAVYSFGLGVFMMQLRKN